MDYRDLLMRYMARVIYEESVDYLHDWGPGITLFTADEFNELHKISAEAMKKAEKVGAMDLAGDYTVRDVKGREAR